MPASDNLVEPFGVDVTGVTFVVGIVIVAVPVAFCDTVNFVTIVVVIVFTPVVVTFYV